MPLQKCGNAGGAWLSSFGLPFHLCHPNFLQNTILNAAVKRMASKISRKVAASVALQ